MNDHPHTCHSMQCILPPHMVEAIKMRGGQKMQDMVTEMESHLEEVREQRVAAQLRHVAAEPAPPTEEGGEAGESGGVPQQEIYDGGNSMELPGTLVRSTGDDPSDDPAVNKAYDSAVSTYRLYKEVFDRDSLDGQGFTLVSTVHHRENFNNAYWNGEQMAYGDGDGVLFQNLAASISVVGHELSHGVVEFSGNLIYRDQSGALNESYADVFGALTEQYQLGQSAAEGSWVIGEGILGPDVNGVGLRSLKAPGLAYDDELLGPDPQPYHFDNYFITPFDNGGVHINSGIPNHAFYLLAQLIGGNAWEKPGQIWYETLQQINNPSATFQQWADKTVEVARNVFGMGSLEAIYTRRAWHLVGIMV